MKSIGPLLRFQGYRCESGIVIFSERVTLNYAYSPFNTDLKICISQFSSDLIHFTEILKIPFSVKSLLYLAIERLLNSLQGTIDFNSFELD